MVQVGKTAGRLKYFYDNWAEITSDSNILSSIRNFKIPFTKIPNQRFAYPEPVWSVKEANSIKNELEKLLKTGAISLVTPVKGQFLSRIFLTPKPDGSKRLILNLKSLNKYVECNHFKIEDHKTVSRLVSVDCYMALIDLKDAYTLIPIKKSDRKYLRFRFKNKIYQYNCLPFGLNCAPLLFTKIMKPVVSYLRSKGWVSVIYIDDILLIGTSKSECENNISATRTLLESLGFVINYKKSCLVPSRSCKYLGFIYNSKNMSISLPKEKREKILRLTKGLMSIKKCKIRKFAQFIGTLTSACPAVKYGWLYTKLLEREKFLSLHKENGNYNSMMKISNELVEDLNWWLTHIPYAENSLKTVSFALEIFSDASSSGWGVFCNGERSRGLWRPCEQASHINFLELLAAFFGLKCFASHLSNVNILCRIDNTTALSYINRMGSVQFPKLNALTKRIWQWCEARNIFIFASYIKSKENVEADQESRSLDFATEYELNRDVFQKITLHFKNPEIDLFASRANKKCKKYVSWLRDPDSCAVDAFTISWKKFYFYAFPPFALILRVLQKVIEDKAEGIIVVPYWTSQPWYPVFCSLLSQDPLHFKPEKNLLLSFDRSPHPLWKSLSLVAGPLSYKRCRKERCLISA